MHEPCLSVQCTLINMLSSQECYGFSFSLPNPSSSVYVWICHVFIFLERQSGQSLRLNKAMAPYSSPGFYNPPSPASLTPNFMSLCFFVSVIHGLQFMLPACFHGATHSSMAGPTRSHTIKESHQLSIASQGWGVSWSPSHSMLECWLLIEVILYDTFCSYQPFM